MKFGIEKCVAWCGNLRTSNDWQLWAQGELTHTPDDDLPPLKQIPAMQRRRLSRFAKLSFHCMLESLGENNQDLACVFASRHGDLHKTAKLIEDVASKDDLSPTHFGLSVHNAVIGLYSIFAKNKSAMTAISAGEDSFMMAMVDAYGKLQSQNLDRILVVYTDEVVPEKYHKYVSDKEKTISVAFVLTKHDIENNIMLTFEPQDNSEQCSAEFQPLEFLRFFFSHTNNAQIHSKRYKWHVSR